MWDVDTCVRYVCRCMCGSACLYLCSTCMCMYTVGSTAQANLYDIPYSAKFSQVFNFANFANFQLLSKSSKISIRENLALYGICILLVYNIK